MNEKERDEQTLDLKEKLGQEIRQIRLDKNLSVEEVSKSTSLTKKQIEEIETGTSTSNNAVERVFIIKYLKFLDSYNDELKDKLDKAYLNNIDELTHTINLAHEVNSINFNSEIKRSKHVKKVRHNTKMMAAIIISLLLIVSLCLVFFINLSNNVNEVTTNETTLMTKTQLDPKEVVDTKPKVNIAQSTTKNTYNISGADSYQVHITFSGPAYIEINQDNIAGTYNSEDNLDFTVEQGKKLAIYTGKYENINISIDGVEVEKNNSVGTQTIKFNFEQNDNKIEG